MLLVDVAVNCADFGMLGDDDRLVVRDPAVFVKLSETMLVEVVADEEHFFVYLLRLVQVLVPMHRDATFDDDHEVDPRPSLKLVLFAFIEVDELHFRHHALPDDWMQALECATLVHDGVAQVLLLFLR